MTYVANFFAAMQPRSYGTLQPVPVLDVEFEAAEQQLLRQKDV